MPSPEVLHVRGREALNRGRHAEARRLLERARSAGPSGDLLARIEASLAYAQFETGSAAEAIETSRAAVAHRDLSDATRGVLHGQLGLLLMLMGAADESLPEFDAALRLLDDEAEVALVLLNRGNVHLQRHALHRAAADFSASEELYRSKADDYGVAKAVHNRGYVALLAGDLPAALRDMAEAYPAFEAEGPVMTAMAQQDRAEALIAAGLIDEGVDALVGAASAYSRRRLYQRQGEAELARARYEADPRAARAAARRARERFQRSAAASWVARAEAEELAADVALGRHRDVDERGDRLAAELDGHGLRWNAAVVRLSVVAALLSSGRAADAQRRLRSIRLTSTAPLSARLLEREVRAVAARRPAAALGHVRAGLADLHAWQSSFGSLDLQTNVVGQGVRLAVRGLGLAVQSRSHAVLFEWSERARMLASRIQPVRAPQDPQLVADLTELRSEPTPERETELRRRIREQAWQTRGSGEVADPIGLPELQAGLGPTTALVAYVFTGDRVVGLVVTEGGTRRHELCDRSGLDALLGGLLPDLDMAASDLPDSLARSVRGALASRLAALADLVVTPLLEDLGDREVVLTPSGVLAGVPWTLLPGLAGRPVTVAQSATSWLARRATPLRAATAGFVAGPRVVRAEAEVRAAADEWGGAPVLAGSGATAAGVSDLAARVDVLHVAAHGRHAAENPLFSGLELVDGTWFGYDIDQLPAVPDVVLLSACEVGRSSVRWGEELIGMTAAWLHAGARCVVASAAAVSDAAAYDVLVRVHRGLAAGSAPASALAEAVGVVTTDTAPAPFVCFG